MALIEWLLCWGTALPALSRAETKNLLEITVSYRSAGIAFCVLSFLCLLSGQANAGSSTLLALSSSKNPTAYGENVTFYAYTNVTGTVQFMDGQVNIGSGTLTAIQGCPFSPCVYTTVADLSTAALAPGVHTITATYAANGQNGPGSASFTQTVSGAAVVSAPTLSSWAAATAALLIGLAGMIFAGSSRGRRSQAAVR